MASIQQVSRVTKDGAMQQQGMVEKALTRARESEVVLDKGRTGSLGHTEVVLFEDFMRSLGIEMSASASKRTTAKNRT